MPDDNNLLTTKQKESAIAWLNERGAGEPICPGCGQKNWQIGNHLVSPPIHSGGMVLGGISYPNFMTICTNCGNTQYFNAVMAEIIETEKEEEKTPNVAKDVEEVSNG